MTKTIKLAMMMMMMTLPAIAQTDYTSKVKNTQAAWGGTGTYTAGGTSMVEYYQAQHFYRNAMCQTIKDLPVGNYEAEIYFNASCADWECTAIASDGDKGYTHIYANDSEVDIPIYNTRSVSSPTLYTLTNIHVTDGVLRLGSHNDREAANWHIIRCTRLTYLGVDAKSLYEALFPLTRQANDLRASVNCADKRDILDQAISAALQAKESDGVEQLQVCYDNLKTAIDECAAQTTEYNAAKKSLVTKMKLFQSKWNNDGDATEESWTNLLEAIKQAAAAKDDQCDTEQLKEATTVLTESLNTATGIDSPTTESNTSSPAYRLNGTKARSTERGIRISAHRKFVK